MYSFEIYGHLRFNYFLAFFPVSFVSLSFIPLIIFSLPAQSLNTLFISNIQLPMFQVRGENNQVTDNEIALAQHYLNSLADTYLNQDMRSEQSINILDTFDDETHTLHDKIRMLMLEKSFIHTVFKNNRLENELYATKKHLTETQTAIAQLCWKVDQLTGGGSVMRQSDPVTPNVFSQSPSSPVINSASLYYPNSQLTIPVSNGQKTQDIIIEFPEIDPNTLVNIAESILLEKGPLPVGEVGKMLQERTKNLQLSQMLKEKHNGLKKFLEKYADRFIMSSDHPFNPHVYLRRCFSPDKQRDIENGSKAFLEEFKKNKVSLILFILEMYKRSFLSFFVQKLFTKQMYFIFDLSTFHK
jgi:hypothetical protein